MLDSVIRTNKKYYAQTLLEECKYKITWTKTENLIKNDLICWWISKLELYFYNSKGLLVDHALLGLYLS